MKIPVKTFKQEGGIYDGWCYSFRLDVVSGLPQGPRYKGGGFKTQKEAIAAATTQIAVAMRNHEAEKKAKTTMVEI